MFTAASSALVAVTAPAVPVETAALSLRTLVPLVQRSGLAAAVCAPEYDATTLQRIASEAHTCEERIATSCFLIQAAALVRCWQLENGSSKLSDHKREIVQYGESEEKGGGEVRHSCGTEC
jgi:hypothetical protein